MTSRRLMVLAFVEQYITQWSESPSYGEIANGLRISPTRARQLVQALVKSGRLLRTPGPRGLTLPSQRDEAVRQLLELGWQMDPAHGWMQAPCAKPALPPPPMLDYDPAEQAEQERQWEKQPGSA